MAGSNVYLDFEGGQYFIAEGPADLEVVTGIPAPGVSVAPSTRLPSGRAAVEEASNIVDRACELLLEMPKDEVGRVGSDLRAACNYVRAYAGRMLTYASPEFAGRFAFCFELARKAAASLFDFENARQKLLEEHPLSLLAFAVKQAAIRNCLENEARVLMVMAFRSRQEVEKVQLLMRNAFAEAIESAADDMEQEVYQALTALAAAVQFHLYDTARPLPRMVRFQFGHSAPSLIYAYRLYQDAGRGDELKLENRVVHPAFVRRSGRALSF